MFTSQYLIGLYKHENNMMQYVRKWVFLDTYKDRFKITKRKYWKQKGQFLFTYCYYVPSSR